MELHVWKTRVCSVEVWRAAVAAAAAASVTDCSQLHEMSSSSRQFSSVIRAAAAAVTCGHCIKPAISSVRWWTVLIVLGLLSLLLLLLRACVPCVTRLRSVTARTPSPDSRSQVVSMSSARGSVSFNNGVWPLTAFVVRIKATDYNIHDDNVLLWHRWRHRRRGNYCYCFYRWLQSLIRTDINPNR